jgi:hypothetical protein
MMNGDMFYRSWQLICLPSLDLALNLPSSTSDILYLFPSLRSYILYTDQMLELDKKSKPLRLAQKRTPDIQSVQLRDPFYDNLDRSASNGWCQIINLAIYQK